MRKKVSLVVWGSLALALSLFFATISVASQNVEFVSQIGGSTRAVAVSGHHAYIGVGPRLVILDVSNAAHPEVAGQTDVLPGIVGGVVVSGNYAYVADGHSGLRIIDVSNFSGLTEVGSCYTLGAVGVAVSGNYAYVADGVKACSFCERPL